MLKAPGSNPPERLERISPANLRAGEVVYIRRTTLHTVDDETQGNVRGIDTGYYECEIREDAGRLVVVNQEPMPSQPPGHRGNLPVDTKLPLDTLDPDDFYKEVA